MLATTGNIHWYDYGPVIGNELSGPRPALIISTTDVNRELSVAVTLPMSQTEPGPRHSRHHVHIAASNSWASVRQIKSVEKSKLGEVLAQATPQEMEKALETLVERLASTDQRVGTIDTMQEPIQVRKGTVWRVQFENSLDELMNQDLLILDYNDGNKMAITINLEQAGTRKSRVRVPMEMNGTNGTLLPVTALVHRIRSIDLSARPLEKVGAVNQDGLDSINSVLLALLDPKQVID